MVKENDIVEYTDSSGTKHEAKVTRVLVQEGRMDTDEDDVTLVNLEFEHLGRTRFAELVPPKPNLSGECYGRTITKTESKPKPEIKPKPEPTPNPSQ